jgi:MGT family glycosyltransferase
MSKIIYLTPPAHGHVNPTLPLMQELVQRGEQITCYNTEEFRPAIEQTGATFRAYATTDMTSTAFSRLLQKGSLASVTGLILRTTEQLLPFLIDELEREKPDLVIFDSIAMWGKMATALLELRAAASISHFIMDERQATVRDILLMLRQVLPDVPGILSARRRLIRRYGQAYPPASPLFPMRDRLNIVFTVRELQPDTSIIDGTFRFVGPSINPQLRREDFPFDALGQGPVVYISLGTIHHTRMEFYRTCFEAFADYGAQFILSVGKQTNIEELGRIPANFVVRPFVPQLEVLQHTDVFITHGGMNSVHEGLYYGVPLLLIPHQFEQLLNARCVAARGAGIIIDEPVRRKPVTATVLRLLLDAVLSDPHYGEAARDIQSSLRATGGYRQAADEISAYLAEG